MSDEIPLPPAPPPKELLAASPAPPTKDILAARPVSSAESSGSSNLTDFFRHRLEAMENELSKERERARQSENMLSQQGIFREEADKQLKMILEQLKAEKAQREREQEKSHDQGRIEALEKRLDEMHQSWMSLVKENIAKRDSGSEQSAAQSAALSAEIRVLSDSVGAARVELAAMRERQTLAPAGFQQAISQLGTTLGEKLTEMDRRITAEVRRHEETASVWARERAAYSETLEEQRHQIRQEYAKERLALQSAFQERLEEFKRGLESIQKGREQDSQVLSGIKDLFAKTNEFLNRPEKVKDQLLRDLELEKRDLMKALEDRTSALRAYTLEHREIERALSEDVAELTRRLEAERAKEQASQSQIAELKLGLDSAQRKEALVQALTAERDNLLHSLVEATQKLQQAAAARAQSEQVWEARTEELREDLEDEKGIRLSAQRQAADLEAKTRALSDHIAQIVSDKEKTEGQHAQWREEREKLLAEIRKKDDLLSMLSATFQGLLKK